MRLKVLKSKIHRATITGADLHYEGSVSIGPDLMDTAGILPFEAVQIYNISNGERLETYAIEGEKGRICLNGAAAWKGKVGDLVIIACYAFVEEEEARSVKPTLVLVDSQNQVSDIG